MSKILSERERSLQRKLIPLNIVVCIISLVAAITLFFLPILQIDAGKIIRNETVIDFVEEKIDEQVGGDLEGTEQQGVDFKPVVASIVTNVLGTAEGKLKISAFSASKVAFAGSDDKTEMVMAELFFGDNALVSKLIDSVVEGVASVFHEPKGQEIIEQVIVSAIATSLVQDLETDSFTDEQIKKVTDVFREQLGKIENNDVSTLVDEVVKEVTAQVGTGVTISDSEKESIRKEVQQIYDDTLAELKPDQKVNMESIICVAVSKNVDLAGFDLNKILDDMLGGNKEEQTPDGGDGEGSASDYVLAEDAAQPEQREIATTYDELLELMNFDEDGLKVKLKTNLETMVGDALDEANVTEYMGYYGYLFYGWLAFIAPWVILFLFSFFHMLAKNKRFTMWYVKLYSFLPCLVFFVAPLVAPKILPLVAPEILEGETGALIPAFLSGVFSYTCISGACYVLLWLFSIFWAFPIKHKIRKERKLCKRARKSGTPYSYDAYGGKPRKGGKRKANDSYSGGYGSSYGSDYGSDLGSSYGSDYGSSFGSDYGTDSYGSYDPLDTGLDPLDDYGSYDDGLDSFDSGFDDFDDDLGF